MEPDSWRKGFGKLLCNAAIYELKKAGYNEVTLWVLDQNQHARQFYEKMGFMITKDVKIDAREGYTLHEIRYGKKL